MARGTGGRLGGEATAEDRYRIRRATLRDLDVLVRQRRDMFLDFGHEPGPALDGQDRAYRRWARERLKNGTLLGWLAEERATGRVVAGGCLWLRSVQPRPGMSLGREPYLLSFATDPDHRGRGLATRIVRACVAWARQERFPRVTLHASEYGRPIYEREGFERTWEMKLDPTAEAAPAPARAARAGPRKGTSAPRPRRGSGAAGARA